MKNKLQWSKALITLLLVSFSVLTSQAQTAASATWALTSNGNASTSGSVTATAVGIGSGIGTQSYNSTSGTSTNSWANDSGSLLNDEYYEYKITPTAGNTLFVNSLTGQHSRSSGDWKVAAYYSLDNFTTRTQIGADTSINSSTSTAFSFTGLQYEVPSGVTFSVRIYAWDSDGNNRSYRNKSIVISGVTCLNMSTTTQPTDQTLCAGNTLTLTSAFSNASSFQWYKNGTQILGATSAIYSKSNTGTGDSGSYYVIATNGCNKTLQSNTIDVVINPLPTNVTASVEGGQTEFCGSSSIDLNGSAEIGTSSIMGVENFENTSTYTASGGSTKTGVSGSGDRPASASFVSSETTSYMVNNGTATITTSNFTGLTAGNEKYIALRLASFSIGSINNGSDSSDDVMVEISLNGGTTYSKELEINGNTNSHWSFSTGTGVASVNYDGNNTATIFAPSGGGARTSDGYSFLRVNLPTSATQVRVKITLLNNSGSEIWVIDDVEVGQTPSPSFAWTSSPSGFTSSQQNPTAVSVNASTVYTITATNPLTSCSNSNTVSVTVTPPASAGTLSGTQAICTNGTTTFASTVSGGSWSSGNTAVATINSSTGVVTPVAAGTATMTYTVTGTGVCSNATATRTVTVTAAPTAGTLSGTQTICSNGTTTFASTLSGGAWSSGNTAVATINSSTGVVTPVAAGTATMTYTITGTGGCSNATATRTVTVTAAPSAGTLSGTQTICSNGTTTFASTVSGGTWSSGNTAVATINSSTGVVTPVVAGTATMTCTITGTGGCSNATATRTVTVTAAPSAGTLSGTQTICSNGTTTFASTVSGGAWSSGNTAVATINSSTGVVTPITAGTATMTYTITGTGGCSNATATRSVTVTAAPTAGTLSGTQAVCINGTTTFASTVSGGSWSSGNTAVATINSSTGVVTPVTAGTATMTYTITGTGGCSNATATRTVTVTANPTAGTLSGTQAVCINGTTTFDSTVSGGAWSSGNTAVATINSSTGVVTPVAAGTATMTYTVTGTGGCSNVSDTRILTVDPASVGGTVSNPSSAICSGSSTTLSLINYTGNIQWQHSTNGNAWFDVNGATSSLYTTPALTQNVYYRAKVTSGECATENSNSVGLTVSPSSNAVLSGTTATCVGGNASLVVNVTGGVGPYTVVYNDGTNDFTVSNYTNGAGISFSPSATKTYSLVSVTNSAGCLAAISGSAVVTVSDATTTWNGNSWSDGEPTSSKAAIISGAFTSPGTNNTPYNLNACKLTVTNNASVVISSGDSVNLAGALTVNPGSLVTFNNNANLLQSGTTNTNSGSIVIKRNSAPIRRLDYTAWSSPVGVQQLLAFSPNTLTNRFYDYNTENNTYQSVDPTSTNFTPVKGYLIRLPNNHSNQSTPWLGQFTGVPNNGNYSMTLQNFGSGKRYNLIGNPYPSPIDADVFISENIANGSITGALYFWRKTNGGTNGGYCTYSLGGFTGNGESVLNLPQYNENSANVIQTGQGFFVEGTGTGTVVFNNDMRVNNTVDRFMRNGATVERNRVWLNVTNTAGAFSQTMIAYMTGATQGVDHSIDGRLIMDGDIALASLIGNESYAIQGRTLPFDSADVVPLSLRVVTPGDYTITIDRVDGLFANNGQTVYLRDNTTGNVHNLSEGSYTFTTASGTFDNRFEVLYQAPLAIATPVFNESQVVIYKTVTNELSINTGNIVMSSVQIFDVTGRLLITEKNINASNVLLKTATSTEILLVQITSNDGVKVTKKVLFPKTAIKTDAKVVVKTLIAEDE